MVMGSRFWVGRGAKRWLVARGGVQRFVKGEWPGLSACPGSESGGMSAGSRGVGMTGRQGSGRSWDGWSNRWGTLRSGLGGRRGKAGLVPQWSGGVSHAGLAWACMPRAVSSAEPGCDAEGQACPGGTARSAVESHRSWGGNGVRSQDARGRHGKSAGRWRRVAECAVGSGCTER